MAKSHTEATFYHSRMSYLISIKVNLIEIKTSKNTSACDELGPVLTKGLPPLPSSDVPQKGVAKSHLHRRHRSRDDCGLRHE